MIDYLRGKLQRLQSDNSEAACALEDLCNLIRNESKSNRLLIDNEKRLYLMEKQIDDSNLALLHEREKTLDLQMECDRLQSQEMKDRKTINKLLELNSQCKCTINSISYFATTEFLESRILVEEVANKIVKTESSNIKSKDICSNGAATKNKDGVDGSKETVESLEMQLECLKTNLAESRSYNENAIKSLNLIIQNQATRLEERNEEKVGALEKLSAVSESYHNRLRDQQKKYVAQINKFSAIENQYLERLDRMRQQIKSNNNSKLSNIGRSNSRSKATETCVKMMKNSLVGSELQQSSTVLNLERTLDNSQSKDLENIQFELKEAQKLAITYQRQVTSLESRLSIAEESKFMSNEKLEKLVYRFDERLRCEKNRCVALRKRFQCEIEGYRNEIKILQNNIKKLKRINNHNILRIGEDKKANIGQNIILEDPMDLTVLKELNVMSSRSAKVIDELQILKRKINKLEIESIK